MLVYVLLAVHPCIIFSYEANWVHTTVWVAVWSADQKPPIQN